jgi:hypothetical protein
MCYFSFTFFGLRYLFVNSKHPYILLGSLFLSDKLKPCYWNGIHRHGLTRKVYDVHVRRAFSPGMVIEVYLSLARLLESIVKAFFSLQTTKATHLDCLLFFSPLVGDTDREGNSTREEEKKSHCFITVFDI